MVPVVCSVRLYEGCWKGTLSQEAVTLALKRTFPEQSDNALVDVEFVEPEDIQEDVALEATVTVMARWCHAEIIRDGIAESLLQRFDPEFESMIEVEVEESLCP